MSKLKERLTYANVMSTIAVFLALSGGIAIGAALKRNSVKSKHIAPEAVQGVDVSEASLSQVPSAANAASAANADTLDGIDSAAFQRRGAVAVCQESTEVRGIGADGNMLCDSGFGATLSLSNNGTITLGVTYPNDDDVIRVVGDGGPVTLSPTDAIADVNGSAGRVVVLIGTSDANTVAVPDNANTALAGPFTIGSGDTLTLVHQGTQWVEISRSDN